MRSLVHRKKDNRKWGVIGGILLIALMFLSVVGYSFLGSPSEDNEKGEGIFYGGFEWFENNGFWISDVGGARITLSKNPNEINREEASLDSIDKYYSKPLYIYFNESLDNYAAILVSTNMQQFVERVGVACLDEKICPEEVPIKTCEDNFIVVQESDSISLRQEDNCVFIEGPSENLSQIADDFILKIVGI
jgi:hypothetical protein